MKNVALGLMLTLVTSSCSMTQAQLKLPFLNNTIQHFDYTWANTLDDNTVIFYREDTGNYADESLVTLHNSDTLKTTLKLNSESITVTKRCGNNGTTISPDGKTLAIGSSRADYSGTNIAVFDLIHNEEIFRFDGQCSGIYFLDNDLLYTPSGVVIPSARSQDISDIPKLDIFYKSGDYIISTQGDVYNLRTKTYIAKTLGEVVGPVYRNLLLVHSGNDYQIVDWQNGKIINEFTPSIDVGFIGLLDFGRVVIANSDGVFIHSLSNDQDALFTDSAKFSNYAPTTLDPIHKHLFLPGGTVVNFK